GVTSTVNFVLTQGGSVTVSVLQVDGSTYPAGTRAAAACPLPPPAVPPNCAGQVIANPFPLGASGIGTMTLTPGVWNIYAGTSSPPAVAAHVYNVTVVAGQALSCTFLGSTGSCTGPVGDGDG